MFKKLRLKLTIINLAIMLALFSLLISGTYYFTQINMARHTHMIAQRIAANVQSGAISNRWPPRVGPGGKDPESDPPPRPGPGFGPISMLMPEPPLTSGPPPVRGMGPMFFFVKTAADGTIIQTSNENHLTDSQLAALTEETSRTDNLEGELTFDEIKYSFLKSPLPDQSGLLIVYHDMLFDANILHAQTTELLIIGLICCLLSFGASFFMANHAMIPIEAAWRQQKRFLSDASHELRTPLAVIQVNLDIVRDNQEETIASQNKWLDNIQEESAAMAKLVNSLFFLARTDAHQQPLDKRPFSLNAMLSRAVAPFTAMANTKEISLQLLDSSPARQYYGDEPRIKQVIGILLDNAIRHTPAGGKIAVSLTAQAARITLTIRDSGEGIAPEHLDKIFNRFYQIDNARTKGGTGLGLAIAKWIIEQHGGSIIATSQPGTGTCFTIQLPI